MFDAYVCKETSEKNKRKKQAIKTSDKNKTRKTGCNKRIFTTKWFVKNECDVVAEGVNKNRKYHLFDESGLVRK